jgi:hypothetical protein
LTDTETTRTYNKYFLDINKRYIGYDFFRNLNSRTFTRISGWRSRERN